MTKRSKGGRAGTHSTGKPDALRSRIVGEGDEAPDQLLANPLNWRVHPKHQVDALEGLMQQVGWVQRVIVNKRTGHVVDGHARVALALRRSEATVPVVYVDLDEAEERLVLASLDPIGGLATTDADMLAQVLDGLEADDPGLQALLDQLAGEQDGGSVGLTDADDTPPMQAVPVALFEYQMLNNTKGGDKVLDSFGGSGTTMIAAEKNGRVACVMELDPLYCDVIVRRWQAFTRQAATLEGDGRTFAEVEAERVPTTAEA